MNTLVDRHQCYFCGVSEPLTENKDNKKFRRLVEVHHIKEKNEGGTSEGHNLVPVCSNCHSKIHIGIINPKKWLFTTSGWKLSWTDEKGQEHFGKPKISINS